MTRSLCRPRLFLGGPHDGEVLNIQQDLRVVEAADTASILRNAEALGGSVVVPITTYVAEWVSIFGHQATIYMAQGMTPEERDAAAFQALLRPELKEALAP